MEKIAIIGAGLVGLNLAVHLAKYRPINVLVRPQERFDQLCHHHDSFGCFSVEELMAAKMNFRLHLNEIQDATIFIVAVQTDLDLDGRPNLSIIKEATKMIASILKPGDLVIYESTIFPKTTNDILIPILEQHSQLKLNQDFYVAYAPERYSPNDPGYKMQEMVKIVALSSPVIEKRVIELYKKISASIYLCPSIEVAECAKILENTQRNTNIALMNEFSQITHALDIPLNEVIKASSTKRGFHSYSPGLVGGYCLPVSPKYIAYQANLHQVPTPLLNAIGKVNNSMLDFIFKQFLHFYFECQKKKPRPKIGFFGLGYKPNVPDIRSSKNLELLNILMNYGLEPLIHDPFPHHEIKICSEKDLNDIDICLIMVKHDVYIKYGLDYFLRCCSMKAVIMDIGQCFVNEVIPPRIHYWSL